MSGMERLSTQKTSTLLCFVLVDPDSTHTFCSRYDFGPFPFLPGVTRLDPAVLKVCMSFASWNSAYCPDVKKAPRRYLQGLGACSSMALFLTSSGKRL